MFLIAGMENRRKYIKPYIDWEVFYDTSIERIRSLLVKGSLSENELVNFIDGVVTIVDKEIPKFDDEEIEEGG